MLKFLQLTNITKTKNLRVSKIYKYIPKANINLCLILQNQIMQSCRVSWMVKGEKKKGRMPVPFHH